MNISTLRISVQGSGADELNASLGGESICEKVGGEKYQWYIRIEHNYERFGYTCMNRIT
jgi:hypothetical protein